VIISDKLSNYETRILVATLKKYQSVIGYSLNNLKGISSSLCTHRIPMEREHKPIREHQRWLNNAMREVVKKEVLNLLKVGVIYLVSNSEWVSPIQVVPKKGGMIVIRNEKNKPIPQRIVTGWWMCIDYQKLNKDTWKDHFLLPFIDEMLERLANHSFCYLDGLIMRKILHSAIDEVLEALSMHVVPSAIQIIVAPTGVTVLLGLYNPLRSWTSTVGPSLPGFTIAPFVDSLLCYRLIR
jgi:hypothetical protein